MLWLPSPPVTRPLALRWLPTVIAVAVLATAGPLGWDKDFGTFLFTLFFYLPVLVILCAGLCIWAVIEHRSPRGRSVCMALAAAVVSAPITFFGASWGKDHARFFLWYATHHGFADQFVGRDAIVLDWESWGIAGSENDAYLVSDPDDKLDQSGERLKWLHNIGSDCEIADAKRLARGLYIATTYNCPLR
jgi:hypothetical protein